MKLLNDEEAADLETIATVEVVWIGPDYVTLELRDGTGQKMQHKLMIGEELRIKADEFAAWDLAFRRGHESF